jgi:hypothetical protein
MNVFIDDMPVNGRSLSCKRRASQPGCGAPAIPG